MTARSILPTDRWLPFAAIWMLGLVLYGLAVQARATPALAEAAGAEEVVVFVRQGCPRCEEAKGFLQRLQERRPGLSISILDVLQHPNRERLDALAAEHGITNPGVPSFYLRGRLIVGFAGEKTSGVHIAALLELEPPRPAADGGNDQTCVQADYSCSPVAGDPDDTLTVRWFGHTFGVQDLGLPLFTVVIGLLDGFNPCSMWVLVMMLALLAATRDRKRMLAIAGTFVIIQGIAYFAFMAAWLNVFVLVGVSRPSEIILGTIAIIAGLVNVKDFWAWGRGSSLSIPASAKPGVYARLRRILHEQRMLAAIAGAVTLAILVQFVELLCTAGFPALYTRILTLRELDGWSYYGYLLLYIFLYMLDDIVILAIGVITLSQRRLQEKEGRWLKAFAGIVMLLLGLYLIAK